MHESDEGLSRRAAAGKPVRSAYKSTPTVSAMTTSWRTERPRPLRRMLVRMPTSTAWSRP